jgi:hypothetical protein
MQHLDDGTLQEWLDRDRSGMDNGHADQVARHVADCGPCRARAVELDALTEVAAGLLTPMPTVGDVHADFDDVRVRARLRPRSRRAGVVGLGRVATVALALGAGWLTNELVRSDRLPHDAERGATFAPPVLDHVDRSPASGRVPTDAGPAPTPSAPTSTETGGTPSPSVAETSPESRASGTQTAAEHTAVAIVVPSPSPPAIPTAAGLAPPSLPVAAVVVPPSVDAVAGPVPGSPRVLGGRVTDDAGRPLSGAQVYVAGSDIGALTREDGTYTVLLGGHPVDTTSVLRVELIGYASEDRPLAVGARDTVTTDFSLTQQALALETIVVTGAAAATRRRAIGNTIASASGAAATPRAMDAAGWRRSSRTDAEARAGFALLLLPDAPVSSIQVRQADDRWIVRVVQRLPSGTEVTLIETRGGPVRDDGVGADGRTVATALRGELSVSAAAQLPLDSLHSLLARAR